MIIVSSLWETYPRLNHVFIDKPCEQLKMNRVHFAVANPITCIFNNRLPILLLYLKFYPSYSNSLVPTTIFLRLMPVNYTHYNDNWVGKWVTSSKTSSPSLVTTLSSSDKWKARHKLSTSKNCLLGKRRLKVKDYEVKCNVSHSECWYLPSVDIKTSEKWIQNFYKLHTIVIFFQVKSMYHAYHVQT